jgi:membrane-bound lytic murein transglycosylase B
VLASLVGVLAVCSSPPAATLAAQSAEVEAFIEEMARKHEFGRAHLKRLFARVQMRPAIVRAMSTPGTARPWHEFRPLYVNSRRIEGGLAFWREHAGTLKRAAAEYSVPEEIIVATIGVETAYGRNLGSFRVLDALATIAFGYPPRAEFFRRELEEFLVLAREGRFDPFPVRGSYAGAIGIPQFLPSSYRRYAVDFDGDDRRDLVGTPADAIGSVANYYRSHGWRPGETAAVPAEASGSVLDAVTRDIEPRTPVAELRRLGVVPLAPVKDDAPAALIAVEGEAGPAYWLGLNNFYVVTRYNRSVNYALAVLELAQELRTAWAAGR